MKVAINGFGRIGRAAFKILLEKENEGVEVVALNDLADAATLAYLLKYDTVYGNYEHEVSSQPRALIVNNKKYPLYDMKDPSQLPWGDLQVDVVIESTGVFTTSQKAKAHLDAGAKKVLISAPAKDDVTETRVFGSGNMEIKGDIVANASCTTNCVTPVIRVLSQKFGLEKAFLTTVHAYTASQSVVDAPAAKDLRLGRAAAQNMIPSSTGAAKATGKAMPEVANIFDGVAIRVPVACGSISDVTALLKKDVTVEEVNQAFAAAQNESEFKGILKYTEEPLVSSDIIKSRYSAIVDGEMTRVVGGNLVKVMAWYDNEWGYSNRLVEMAMLLGGAVRSPQ